MWRHCNHYSDDIMNSMHRVSNHRRLESLPNRLFRRWSKKTSKLRVTGLCDGNLPVAGKFSTQKASNAENVSIWWRHHNSPFSYMQMKFGIQQSKWYLGSNMLFEDHSSYGLSQWEITLCCNVVSYRLSPHPVRTLLLHVDAYFTTLHISIS